MRKLLHTYASRRIQTLEIQVKWIRYMLIAMAAFGASLVALLTMFGMVLTGHDNVLITVSTVVYGLTFWTGCWGLGKSFATFRMLEAAKRSEQRAWNAMLNMALAEQEEGAT